MCERLPMIVEVNQQQGLQRSHSVDEGPVAHQGGAHKRRGAGPLALEAMAAQVEVTFVLTFVLLVLDLVFLDLGLAAAAF